MHRCEFAGCAPIIIDYDGRTPTSAATTLHISDNVVDQVAGGGDMIFLKITNGGIETLTINNNTFNGRPNSTLTVVDATAIGEKQGVPYTLDSFRFDANEWDHDSNCAAARMLKLKNVRNGMVSGSSIYGGGQATSVIDLEASTIHLSHNTALSVNGPLVTTLDARSNVFYEHNNINLLNVPGLINNAATSAGIVNVPEETDHNGNKTFMPFGHLGNPGGHTVYQLDVGDVDPFTVVLGSPSSSPPHVDYWTRGQTMTLLIRNRSGGKMGVITFALEYKTSAPDPSPFDPSAPDHETPAAFAAPGPGKSRNITFVFDGTYLVELWRSSADVAN
jgi:hypothetical protein